MQWVVVPVIQAGVQTNVPRTDTPVAETLGFTGPREVSFAAHGGLRLSAWFVPGRNGAAVILAHGSHGDRADTIDHLRLLAGAGYAVLAFDARGHGDSSGQANALGWRGDDDVAGAVEFLPRAKPASSTAPRSRSMVAASKPRATSWRQAPSPTFPTFQA